jgi:hypothetical protein
LFLLLSEAFAFGSGSQCATREQRARLERRAGEGLNAMKRKRRKTMLWESEFERVT